MPLVECLMPQLQEEGLSEGRPSSTKQQQIDGIWLADRVYGSSSTYFHGSVYTWQSCMGSNAISSGPTQSWGYSAMHDLAKFTIIA